MRSTATTPTPTPAVTPQNVSRFTQWSTRLALGIPHLANPAMTIDADTIRAAAHDARALLDLLETLTGGSVCLYRAHKQSGPPGHRQYEMYDSEIEVRADGRLASELDAYLLLGEIMTACLHRRWDWSVGSANSTEHGYHGPAVGAWVDGWGVDMRITEHAPALALLASYLLAVLATRDA